MESVYRVSPKHRLGGGTPSAQCWLGLRAGKCAGRVIGFAHIPTPVTVGPASRFSFKANESGGGLVRSAPETEKLKALIQGVYLSIAEFSEAFQRGFVAISPRCSVLELAFPHIWCLQSINK